MKDSQRGWDFKCDVCKYIKADNERFSTRAIIGGITH